MTDHPARPRIRRRTRVLARLRRLPRWSLVAAGTAAGGLLGGAYGVLQPPAYTATSYVVAVPAERTEAAAALGFAQAYGRVATQLAVLADAQHQVRVPVRTLRRDVRTSTSPDAPMVAVSATAARPALAADMADAVAEALTRHAADTEGSTHVRLVPFARAVLPTDPSSAAPPVTGLIGASAGGLLGGLALLARPRRAEPGRTAPTAQAPRGPADAPAPAVPAPAPAPAAATHAPAAPAAADAADAR
ncbi:lipopolysaccharide biosynthesis protein [Streptomyces sp. NPDC047017]|uniref:lipopolysaccharide biosynthesis protein n=1 Tax=Streptomyces sp. NPDC047017 TaxID=3155024 RepID=UPI0033C3476E